MNAGKRSIALLQMYRRYASSASKEVAGKNFNKLKETQKKFQCDDGVPVYLKAGFKDKVLYQLTLVLVAIGLGMSGETLYRLAVK